MVSKRLVCAGVVMAAGATAHQANAQAIDGTLSGADGYSLLSLQTNVTASPSSEAGGASGPANEVAANNTAPLDQLSNAYGKIDQATQTLNLFLGGSLGSQGNTGGGSTDATYFIALQTEAGGVPNLNGIFGGGSNGGFGNLAFDAGFLPNFVIEVNTSVVGQTHQDPGTTVITSTQATNPLVITETDLTAANSATSAVTAALNNALQTTAVGAGANVSFADVTTGLELSIPLASLGYTPGTDVLASALFDIGTDTRTTNQFLSPFTYNPNDASSGYDYTYLDSKETDASGNVTPGRQTTGVDYPGNQYFTIPGSEVIPEPASLGLIGLGSCALLRRVRKA